MNYRLPITAKVTQGFGLNPNFYKQFNQAGHNGIDYGARVGTPVRATADGTVLFEGWGQHHPWAGAIAGIYILLKHSNGHSGYAHLSRTIIDKGQKVKAGQIIGYLGASGFVTGPHLHFETYPLTPKFRNGFAGRINPAEFKLGIPDVKRAMLAITTGVAHVRSRPSIKAPLAGSRKLAKGLTFEYVSIVNGDKVSGNNKWYKSKVGNYVWSGNVRSVK